MNRDVGYLQQYRKHSVEGASPLRLIIMLYDGCLRNVDLAKQHMESGDIYKRNEAIQKAQKIVGELMACLDMQAGSEIAKSLFALYSFVYNRLLEANIEDNAGKLDEVTQVLSELRESWESLEESRIAVSDEAATSEPAVTRHAA